MTLHRANGCPGSGMVVYRSYSFYSMMVNSCLVAVKICRPCYIIKLLSLKFLVAIGTEIEVLRHNFVLAVTE